MTQTFGEIYLKLWQVLEDGFEQSVDSLEILRQMAKRGHELRPHPDWQNIIALSHLHEKNNFLDEGSRASLQWVLKNQPEDKFLRLGVLAYDDGLLQAGWNFGDSAASVDTNFQLIGPYFKPVIVRDLARAAVGWYDHPEFEYSDQDVSDQRRQGHLTRKQGEGQDHLGDIALFPIVVWGCINEVSKASLAAARNLKPFQEISFIGGYASGDIFEYKPRQN